MDKIDRLDKKTSRFVRGEPIRAWRKPGVTSPPAHPHKAIPQKEHVMPAHYPLPESNLSALGFAARPLDHLDALIQSHIAEARYPGAQIALARNGKLALFRSYGDAKTEGGKAAANNETLFLLFSQTKVLTSSAIWTLVEEGGLSFMDKVADHLPEFAVRGKADITLQQVMTHQGGFPSGDVTQATWTDHAQMRAQVCDFSLEWTPGSRLQYHPRAAHLVQAMVLEAVTGKDYRDVIRERVIEPLGLGNDIFVGVPPAQQSRCADTYAPEARDNSAAFRAAGLPNGGGYATARGMAAFYQMLGYGGRLNDVRLFSPRLIAYVSRSHTGETPDHAMSGIPMHRGLGPHVRGTSDSIRGLGTIAAPVTFGHGGVGSSYSWADPSSGVSFTYLTNFVSPDPWHSLRLDRVANLVHAAID
jgi:CubicO group peptidase (beta-lactamase class C family)